MGKLTVGLLLNPSESVIRYFIFTLETKSFEATAEALKECEISAHPLPIAATALCLNSRPQLKLFYYFHTVKKIIVKDQRRRVLVVTMAVIWSGR
jgi:hypothetical protein